MVESGLYLGGFEVDERCLDARRCFLRSFFFFLRIFAKGGAIILIVIAPNKKRELPKITAKFLSNKPVLLMHSLV